MKPRFDCIPENGFQQVVHQTDWPFDDSNTSGKQCRPIVENVLVAGNLPQVLLPNPRRKCQLSNDVIPIRNKLFTKPSVNHVLFNIIVLLVTS